MNRLDKCIALKKKGYTYDKDTGKIYGVFGKEITRKDNRGYIILKTLGISNLYGHHYAWFMTYGNVNFELLDHKDINKSNNKIDNLRIISSQQNSFNKNSKGYCFDKSRNKWLSKIKLNGKTIYLGRYNTEEEARQAYLNAKKNYHQI